MTTTVEAPPANQHQPTREENALRCAAEDCSYSLYVHGVRRFEGMQEGEEAFFRSLFTSQHSAQYEPGNAPDITVEWELVAECSVCPDGGEMEMCEDGDAVCCAKCSTHWSMNGTHGTRDEDEQ